MADVAPKVYVIADYGKGDAAFAEVAQFIDAYVPGVRIHTISVEPYSTIQTGFWVNQMALNDKKLRERFKLEGKDVEARTGKSYLYVNTAPRRDDSGPRRDNDGEKLVYARLATGLEIVGVFSGETFSFVKPLINIFREFDPDKVPTNGSQFRSRDIFPEALGKIVAGEYSVLGKELAIASIPEPSGGRIGHRDKYGNIKLTTKESEAGELRPGDMISIEIGGKKKDAIFTAGMFSVNHGSLCLAPGSSGQVGDRYLEISRRGGNAWKDFGKPRIETEVRLRKIGVSGRILAAGNQR